MAERLGNQYGRACNRGASLIFGNLNMVPPDKKAVLEEILGHPLPGGPTEMPTAGGVPGNVQPGSPAVSPGH